MSTTESAPTVKSFEDYWRESAAKLVAVPPEADFAIYRAAYLRYALTVFAIETASGCPRDIVADDMNRRFRNGLIDASSEGWDSPCDLQPRNKKSWCELVERQIASSLMGAHKNTPNPQDTVELLTMIDAGEIMFMQQANSSV